MRIPIKVLTEFKRRAWMDDNGLFLFEKSMKELTSYIRFRPDGSTEKVEIEPNQTEWHDNKLYLVSWVNKE